VPLAGKGFDMERKPSRLESREETTDSLFIGRRSRKKIFVTALGALAASILVSAWLFGKDKFVALLDASDELATIKAEAAMEQLFIQSLIDRGLLTESEINAPRVSVPANTATIPEGKDLDKAHKQFHEDYNFPEEKGGGKKNLKANKIERKEEHGI